MAPQDSFIDRLPFETVVAIFSHLNKQQCLICMSVCHDWFERLPFYVKDTWATVRFTENKSRIKDIFRDRCLGKHVKKVEFDTFIQEDALYAMLKRLIELKCDEIKSIAT
ncbi:hypothetical protein BDB00DRAFT_345005 [Zychaea mexicana]|uniref:uncharacterized protein n=1 Tax=Zychaea mexicana TaxID=64656 RepID=UPI0022FED4C9|nr:uncharacterized protein BDB00DRAFT_345005 [Zychaea mexicana]KAI9494067.1 hypothetical protein BDB00DRAFT_345005 [Zychaea mexicana]